MEKIGNVSTTTTTDSTIGYIDANVGPHPCPSCGRCPTCGLGGYNTPYQPWWRQVYPYYRYDPYTSPKPDTTIYANLGVSNGAR